MFFRKKELICKACGHVGEPARSVKGSLMMEILLWLLAIIPGVVYSLWRQSTYHDVCALCKSPDLIPIDTPLGQQLVKKYGKSN